MKSLSIRFHIGLSRETDTATERGPSIVDARAESVVQYLSRDYPSLTATRALGYWQGAAEPSLTVEAIVSGEPEYETARAKRTAARLAFLHRQTAVGLSIASTDYQNVGPSAGAVHPAVYRESARDLEAEEAAGRG